MLPYHIRVIIPCYKEPLDVIQKTVTAALVAPIPDGCLRTGTWGGGGPATGDPQRQPVGDAIPYYDDGLAASLRSR